MMKCISRLLLLFLLCSYSLQARSGNTLADAIQSQEFEKARTLLSDQTNINEPQADGMTALHWAVHHNHHETTKQLVDAGANVNITNRYGVTPLYFACLNGNGEIVELLLKAGANPNASLYGGETLLMTAARTGKVEPIELLLEYGANIDGTDRKNQSAIMWAAAEGHNEVVKFLIEKGADFDDALDSGFTPFFFAVREGHTEVVNTLLDAGIDVNDTMDVERRSGDSPDKGTSPLILAVENGHFELAIELVKAGADPNDQRAGYTPLHNITWVRKPDRGDNGDPSPIGSGKLSSLQFVEQIVALGADVNARLNEGGAGKGRLVKEGMTPFFMAADTADIPLMKLLLDLGANPHIPNARQTTPLMAAVGLGTFAPTEEAGTEEEALEAVRMILDLGADMNHVNDIGETTMHGAAYASFPKMVRFLDQNGADIRVWNKPNKYGWTPWHIAKGYRVGNFKPSFETIDALREVMIKNGVTPDENAKPKRMEIY